MRKISNMEIGEIRYLYAQGYSENSIVNGTDLSKGTVVKYLKLEKFRAIKQKNKQASYNHIRKINWGRQKNSKAHLQAQKSSNPSYNVTKNNLASSSKSNTKSADSAPLKNNLTQLNRQSDSSTQPHSENRNSVAQPTSNNFAKPSSESSNHILENTSDNLQAAQDEKLKAHLNHIIISNLNFHQLANLFNQKNKIYKEYTTQHSTLLINRLQELERSGEIQKEFNKTNSSIFSNIKEWLKKQMH